MNAMTIQCLIAMVLWFVALWFATYITTKNGTKNNHDATGMEICRKTH